MSDEITPDSSGEQPNDLATVTREAASRRRELRAEQAAKAEVEAERDDLRARLDASDRREVQRMATEALADPADLWLTTSIDNLRDGDGSIDFEKAEEAIWGAVKAKPHWRKKQMPNLHGGAYPEPVRRPSFGEALKKG